MFDGQSPMQILRMLAAYAGIWLVLSIPAYAALTVWTRVGLAWSAFVEQLTRLVNVTLTAITASAARVRDDLQQRMTWFEVDEVAQSVWLKTVDRILSATDANSAELTSARTIAANGLDVFRPLVSRLKHMRLASDLVPTIPDISTVYEPTQKSRVAFTNVIIATLLLVPIVAANAQLTGLVLSEVIPPVRPLLGIPIPLLVAAVLVLTEAAIGVLHSTEAESRLGTERAFTLMAAVWTFAGLAVVAIEAMLYQFVQPENVTALPVVGSVFGLVGGVLGLAVFGLGRLWHHSLTTFRKERTAKAIAKHLLKLRHAAEDWNAIAERIAPRQAQAVAHFETLAQSAAAAAEVQVSALLAARAELEKHRVALPEWAKPSERPVPEEEFQHREARMYVWLLVSFICVASLVFMSAVLARRLSAAFCGAVGSGTAAAAFSAGVVAASSIFERKNRLRVVLGAVGLGALIGIGSARFIRGEFNVIGMALSIPAIGLSLAGAQLGPDAALLRLPVWFALRVVATLTLWSSVLFSWSIRFIIAVVDYTLQLLAWPISFLLSLRHGSPTEHNVEV